MGLVRCPECEKENVSDTAVACPNCGFNVNEYYKSQHIQTEISNEQLVTNMYADNTAISQENQQFNVQKPINVEQQIVVDSETIVSQSKTKKSKKKTIFTVIIFLLLFLVGIAIGVLIAKKNKDDKATTELTEYEEQSTINSDIQLCKTIKVALETAATDSAVANEPNYQPFRMGDSGSVLSLTRGGNVFVSSYNETLGVDEPSEVKNYIKSSLGKKEGDIRYVWVSDSSVVVYIDNTDKNASSNKPHTLTSNNCQCIYSGPVELYWK